MDQAHVAQLLMRHRTALHAYIFAAVRHHNNAEDILQNVSLAAVESSSQLADEAGFLPWSLEITRGQDSHHLGLVHGRAAHWFGEVSRRVLGLFADRQDAGHVEHANIQRDAVGHLDRPRASRVRQIPRARLEPRHFSGRISVGRLRQERPRDTVEHSRLATSIHLSSRRSDGARPGIFRRRHAIGHPRRGGQTGQHRHGSPDALQPRWQNLGGDRKLGRQHRESLRSAEKIALESTRTNSTTHLHAWRHHVRR